MNLNNKGFTLIEVLAVLVILSAIIGLAIPSFASSLERKSESKIEDKSEIIESAAEMYVTDQRKVLYNWLSEKSLNKCRIKTSKLLEEGYLPANFELSDKDISGDSYVTFLRIEYSFSYDATGTLVSGVQECFS